MIDILERKSKLKGQRWTGQLTNIYKGNLQKTCGLEKCKNSNKELLNDIKSCSMLKRKSHVKH